MACVGGRRSLGDGGIVIALEIQTGSELSGRAKFERLARARIFAPVIFAFGVCERSQFSSEIRCLISSHLHC